MKKYNVYGGNALRALEGELTLKTQIMIQSATKSSNKYLSSMKRYKSNELNPYAQDEMIKLLESEKRVVYNVKVKVKGVGFLRIIARSFQRLFKINGHG